MGTSASTSALDADAESSSELELLPNRSSGQTMGSHMQIANRQSHTGGVRQADEGADESGRPKVQHSKMGKQTHSQAVHWKKYRNGGNE